jgi:hypothetical protein
MTDETAMKNINGIIPDLALQLGHLSRNENSLVGCDHLAKTKDAEREQAALPQEMNGFRLRSKTKTN